LARQEAAQNAAAEAAATSSEKSKKADKGKKKDKSAKTDRRAKKARNAFTVKKALLGAERALLNYAAMAVTFAAGGVSLHLTGGVADAPNIFDRAGIIVASASVPTMLFGVLRYVHYRRFFIRALGQPKLPKGYDASDE